MQECLPPYRCVCSCLMLLRKCCWCCLLPRSRCNPLFQSGGSAVLPEPFKCSLPLFSHSLSHIIWPTLPGARLEEKCSSAPSHPPSTHSILGVLGVTAHLFYPDSTLMFFLYFPSSSCLSVSLVKQPLPPLFKLGCSLSFPLHRSRFLSLSLRLSGEMRAVLYFAVTLKTAFIRFMLR